MTRRRSSAKRAKKEDADASAIDVESPSPPARPIARRPVVHETRPVPRVIAEPSGAFVRVPVTPETAAAMGALLDLAFAAGDAIDALARGAEDVLKRRRRR